MKDEFQALDERLDREPTAGWLDDEELADIEAARAEIAHGEKVVLLPPKGRRAS